MDFIKSQFIEVIEWTDNWENLIAYRFPVHENEIKMGAQLIVRESQVAILINEGRLADLFTPGRYSLSTKNMPILTKLKSWKYGFDSPFKAEVYFINTKQFTNQKWGTSNPIMMRDAEFGMLRLRAFGTYSFKVDDPAKFLQELLGTNEEFITEEINQQLRSLLLSGITDLIAELRIPALDLATKYNELGTAAVEQVQSKFEPYGLELLSVNIENISLPEEVEKVLDKRTSMGILGNMQQYTQYQTAEAIRDAARNPGMTGTGVGFGVAAGIGQVMGNAMAGLQQPVNQAPVNQAPMNAMKFCTNCQTTLNANAKFCSNCGTPCT